MPLTKVIGELLEPNSITPNKLLPPVLNWNSTGPLNISTINSQTTLVSSVSTNLGNTTSIRLINEQRIYSRNTASGQSFITLNNTTSTIDNVIQQFRFALDGATMRPRVFTGRTVYIFTGGDQAYTVPAGIRFIFVKLWGAGGGEGRAGGWSYGADGGGGGHTRGIIPVTPGETLTLVVGRGGLTDCWNQPYGGGGWPSANSNLQYGGLGGGYAGIFRGAAGVPANALLVAGGGGGGGSTRAWSEGQNGGAGGGRNGCAGESIFDNRQGFAGNGGTQTSAGSAPSIGGITTGSQFNGGRVATNGHGGGGGAGWWGGGGGGYAESNTMGGGGGGSGYVHNSVILGDTFAGCGRAPAFFWDSDLNQNVRNGGPVSCGVGGKNHQNGRGTCTQSGGDAIIVIYH